MKRWLDDNLDLIVAGLIVAIVAGVLLWAGGAFGAEAPRVPATAATLALRDLSALPAAVRPFRRYVWCPEGSDEQYAVAAYVVNTVISRTSTDVIPARIAGGALVAVDFTACADDLKEVQILAGLWAELAKSEPYFHVHRQTRLEIAPYVATDGKTYKQRVVSADLPAPYLGTAGPALEAAMGNPAPESGSVLPIVRLDWLVSKALSAVDGGFYYRFRGLEPGKTKLNDYLVARGVDRKAIEKRSADDAEICMSQVTGRARGVVCLNSSGVKPSAQSSLVSITEDNNADRIDPKQDAFLSLLDHAPDAFEVILTLPSGWLEYTLWNAQGTLLAEAPPNVVSDHTIPAPYQKRLQSAISCIRCHGANDGWQPFDNELKALLGDRGRLLTDISRGASIDKQYTQYRRILDRYSGDLGPVVKQAQDGFDRRCFSVCGLGAKDSCAAVSAVYGGYEYQPVSALTACRELGFAVPADDPLGVKTFRQIAPPANAGGLIPDHAFIARLASSFRDPANGKEKGLVLTRLQWEQIYADLAIRSFKAAQNVAKSARAMPAAMRDEVRKRLMPSGIYSVDRMD